MSFKVVIKHSSYFVSCCICCSFTNHSIFRIVYIKFIGCLEFHFLWKIKSNLITFIYFYIIRNFHIFIFDLEWSIFSITIWLFNCHIRISYLNLCAFFCDLCGLFSFSGSITFWISYKSCRSLLWACRGILRVSLSIVSKCKCSKSSYC